MSRCSSLPSIGPQSIFRTSAASHGPTPTVNSPLFKDGYVYVDIKTYRALAKIHKSYASVHSRMVRESPKGVEKTAMRRIQRNNAKNIRKFKKYLDSVPVHNAFPNDVHSEYLRFMYTPSALSENTIDLNSIRLPKSITKHPKFNSDLRLPRQLPIHYGSKDTRSWSNDRRDPFLTPYLLQKKLAVLEKRPVGDQLKSFGSDPFVYVGSNTRYVHKDKLAYVLRSWHNDSRLDRKTLDKAIDLTVQQYLSVKLKPMTYREVISSQQFLKNRTHDTGFSGIGFKDKFDLATTPSFVAFTDKFEKSKNHSATFKLFWKTEALKESKASFVPRLIFGGSIESEIVERKQFQHFSKNLKDSRWNTPSEIGISNIEFQRLYKHHNFHKGWKALAVDYSKQDIKMPRSIIDARTRVLAHLSQLSGYSIHDVNKVVNASKKVSSFNALTPTGEVFHLDTGVPSGLYLGAEGNTLNHSIIGNYLDLRLGFVPHKTVDSRYGDDWLRSLKPTRQNLRYLSRGEELFRIVDKELGMQTTVDLWGETPLNHHEPSFLRRSFTEWTIDGKRQVVPIFEADRTLQKWSMPHSIVSTPQDSFDRSLVFDVVWSHPRPYGLIRNYMDQLILNHPEIKVPDVYKSMTLTSLTKDYYTPSGKPVLTLSSKNPKYFAPEFVPTQRIIGPDREKLTSLSQLSHSDILLSGDIEENPGPIKSTKNVIRHFQLFLKELARNGISYVPSFSDFLNFKQISFSTINKHLKTASLVWKIYKKTIPGLTNAMRKYRSYCQQKLRDRFRPASEDVISSPMKQNIHSEGLLRAISRSDTGVPFQEPCPYPSRIKSSEISLRPPRKLRVPGDWPCGIDSFYHECPLQEISPHCTNHCPFYDSVFDTESINDILSIDLPSVYRDRSYISESAIFRRILLNTDLEDSSKTIENFNGARLFTSHTGNRVFASSFGVISGFNGTVTSLGNTILLS
ncbi:RNA dependent RNA polymerase [Aspergillus foetidus slow virus 2]|uniref:RNA dependent RNA polymerase n=1 Tax=Aspergillus foetidus slow virus 2 TaxID=1087071 RepID=A0ABM9Q1Q3_9VIRU|nr:RNA dependent RNA polymerase [Aspergillus foetidus slow virus 2]CCD33025.1 RNA dependent RNA polymerase [Aspergillus foetidus slow virus 2]